MKRLIIRIPSELKLSLGIIALKKGVNMTDIVKMLIEDYVFEEARINSSAISRGGLKQS